MIQPAITTSPNLLPSVTANALQPDLNSWVLGLGALGLGLGAVGSYMEGEATAAALEFNASMAEIDAEQVEKAKEHELYKTKRARRKLLARQVAATAASGRSFSGSPLEVMARSESEALRDEAIIRSNAATAKGSLYAKATFDKARAKTEKKLAVSKSLSGLLISGSNMYAKSNYFKKRGKNA